MSMTTTDACRSCAGRVVAGDAFCERCGAAVPAERRAGEGCTSCGSPITVEGGGYCDVCGRRQPEAGDHMEAEFGGAAAVSDKGRRRCNQDAFALWVEPDGGTRAVVCDGVSTTSRPEEAARRAALASLATLRRSPLTEAYTAALDAVADLGWDPAYDHDGPPACTLLAATVGGDCLQLLSVGDCRAFWIPTHGEPTTLTQDDSWAAEQVAAGSMTTQQAYADRRAHGITRWIGIDADPVWKPRTLEFRAPGPGRLVLCSDGLWNYAADAADVAIAAGDGSALAVARRLVDFAITQGGHDNVTVVVVDVPAPVSRPADHAPKGHTP